MNESLLAGVTKLSQEEFERRVRLALEATHPLRVRLMVEMERQRAAQAYIGL